VERANLGIDKTNRFRKADCIMDTTGLPELMLSENIVSHRFAACWNERPEYVIYFPLNSGFDLRCS
jgi:hypothetical protein